RHAFEFVERGLIQVRGRQQPVRAYEVVSLLVAGLSRWRQGHNLRLIGRGPELSAILLGLARAVGGQGNVVFLVGEAGVGKTRLLDELYAQLGGAASWYVVSPPSYAATIPYSGIVALVRALLEVDERLPEPELR